MPLKYAGISLPLATPQLRERLERIHPQTTFDDWNAWNFMGYGLEKLPTPPLPTPPRFKLNVLHWPTGATRPAWFHAVVNRERLDAIRAVVGNPMTPQPLTLMDGRTGPLIEPPLMYMLPSRPLNQLGLSKSDGWLLTLTDQRFYWGQWKRCTIPSAPTWDSLFAQLASALGISILLDTIDPRYQTPSNKWLVTLAPTATVLDAAACQVGQRVVVELDGTVKTVNWQTAFQNSDDQLGTRIDTVPVGKVTKQQVISGGMIDSDTTGDIGRYVPAECGVAFYTSTDGSLHEETRTLAYLAVYGYGAATGLSGTKGWVYADYPLVPGINDTAVSDYADIAATDWYGWRIPDVDVSIAGIATWIPTGWEDYIEWTYTIEEGTDPEDPLTIVTSELAFTLVRRGYWDDFVSGSWVGPGVSPPPPPPPITLNLQTKSCLVFGDSGPYPTGITNEYVTVTFPPGTIVSAPICITDPICCNSGVTCCDGILIPSILYTNLQPSCGPASNNPLTLLKTSVAGEWVGVGLCTPYIEPGSTCDTAPSLSQTKIGYNITVPAGVTTGYLSAPINPSTDYYVKVTNSTTDITLDIQSGSDCAHLNDHGFLIGNGCVTFNSGTDTLLVIEVFGLANQNVSLTITIGEGTCP